MFWSHLIRYSGYPNLIHLVLIPSPLGLDRAWARWFLMKRHCCRFLTIECATTSVLLSHLKVYEFAWIANTCDGLGCATGAEVQAAKLAKTVQQRVIFSWFYLSKVWWIYYGFYFKLRWLIIWMLFINKRQIHHNMIKNLSWIVCCHFNKRNEMIRTGVGVPGKSNGGCCISCLQPPGQWQSIVLGLGQKWQLVIYPSFL